MISMTEKESIQLTIWMWGKIARDWMINRYYGVTGPSDNDIENVKNDLIHDAIFEHGNIFGLYFAYQGGEGACCSLCAFDDSVAISTIQCFNCPMLYGWGAEGSAGKECFSKKSIYRKIVETLYVDEIFPVYCMELVRLAKKRLAEIA